MMTCKDILPTGTGQRKMALKMILQGMKELPYGEYPNIDKEEIAKAKEQKTFKFPLGTICLSVNGKC